MYNDIPVVGSEVIYKDNIYEVVDYNDIGELELEDNSDPYNKKYLWVWEDEVEPY